MSHFIDKKLMPKLEEAEKIHQELKNLPIPCNEAEKIIIHKSSGQQAAKGFAASMNVVSGVLVGGLIGYGLDVFLNTSPYAMVILFPIGMIAGFRNMIRSLDEKN
jgi:F0F1-type ATP synthase assembly protein I